MRLRWIFYFPLFRYNNFNFEEFLKTKRHLSIDVNGDVIPKLSRKSCKMFNLCSSSIHGANSIKLTRLLPYSLNCHTVPKEITLTYLTEVTIDFLLNMTLTLMPMKFLTLWNYFRFLTAERGEIIHLTTSSVLIGHVFPSETAKQIHFYMTRLGLTSSQP